MYSICGDYAVGWMYKKNGVYGEQCTHTRRNKTNEIVLFSILSRAQDLFLSFVWAQAQSQRVILIVILWPHQRDGELGESESERGKEKAGEQEKIKMNKTKKNKNNNNNNTINDKLTNMKRVRSPDPCNQNGPKPKLKIKRKNKFKTELEKNSNQLFVVFDSIKIKQHTNY